MKYLPALLLLTACGHAVLTPVTVKVPVPVACHVQQPEQPAWPTLALQPDAGMFERTKAVLAELELRKAYEMQLVAALDACA